MSTPTPTPTGSISLAIEYLRQLLAQSATFQAWTGTDSGTVLTRIHHTALPRPDPDAPTYTLDQIQAARPFAIADLDRSGGGMDVRKVAEQAYSYSGCLILWFEDNIDPAIADDYQATEVTFLNTIGAIIDEMASISGQPGVLNVHRFTVADGPHRADRNEATAAGDYHSVAIRVEYGP